MKLLLWILFALMALPVLAGCRSTREKVTAPNSLGLRSTAFSIVDNIPKQFTCDGADVSPALSWHAAPAGTKSLALIVYDQSTASSFTHWQIYNLPPDTRSLPRGVSSEEQLPNGARQTANSFNKPGYGGPCPPHGNAAHQYVFELYALDTMLHLPQNADQQQLRDAMQGHILSEGRITSSYQR